MRCRALVGAWALSLAFSPAVLAGDLTLTMSQGRVTLVAANVPLRLILNEWARIGQTTVIGSDKLAGPSLTLELRDVPERQALETLLRSASGYVVAPRAVPAANASVFDRILILPTSAAPPAPVAGPAGRTVAPPPPMIPDPAGEVTAEDGGIPTETSGEEEDEEDNQVEEDAEQPPPIFNPYPGANRPTETNFDYSNPQQMMRQRQLMLQQQQQAQPQTGAPVPGTIMPGVVTPAPSTFPGTVAPPQRAQPAPPATVPGAAAGMTTSRPGEIAAPPQQPGATNPYGLPPGVEPGSMPGPPVEPDRSKYMNPYQPRPPQPE